MTLKWPDFKRKPLHTNLSLMCKNQLAMLDLKFWSQCIDQYIPTSLDAAFITMTNILHKFQTVTLILHWWQTIILQESRRGPLFADLSSTWILDRLFYFIKLLIGRQKHLLMIELMMLMPVAIYDDERDAGSNWHESGVLVICTSQYSWC